MKNQIIAVISLAVALFVGAYAYLNRPPKIAYAETSVILSEFSEAIKARKQFETQQAEWDKNLKLINDSLVASMDRMKAGYEQAEKDDQEVMRKNLNKWNDDLNRYTQAVKKMSAEKDQELMTPVINKVNSFMKIWGTNHGYDLILGTMSGGNILQANEKFNVTARLLKDLNEHYKDLPDADVEKKAKPDSLGQEKKSK